MRTIEGGTAQLDVSATDLPYGLSYDPSTHRLLVSIYSNTAASNRVLAFYAGDTGNVQADHVLETMLTGLGAEVASLTAPFEPEAGAYAHGHHPAERGATEAKIHQYK